MEQMLRLSSNIQIFRSRCYIATQQKMSTWALIPWIPITMWWLWWLPQSCYAKTPRGSTRAPTLAPGDGRPNLGIPRGKDQRKTAGKATQKPLFHLPVGWSENTQLPEQLLKKWSKNAPKLASLFLVCQWIFFRRRFYTNFDIETSRVWVASGSITTGRKRDWRAISSHVELEWLNEATALWLIFSLRNEETAKQETPLSCWWGILAALACCFMFHSGMGCILVTSSEEVVFGAEFPVCVDLYREQASVHTEGCREKGVVLTWSV